MNKKKDNSMFKSKKDKNEKIINTICPMNQCTACFACQAVCPKNAITIVTNEYGYTFPQIIQTKCIECRKCSHICPQINSVSFREPCFCFAAQAKNKNEMNKSSSGAIGALLAKEFINRGGIVFGCCIINGMTKHTGIDTISGIEGFRGSKYVQSDMSGIIQEVVLTLKQNRKVLFFGTPCQIAGVLSATKGINKNLYCVDIICHGVPPQQYLHDHIHYIVGKKKIDSYSFRGGKDDFYLNIYHDKKLLYHKDKTSDPYYYAFMEGLDYRDNCYDCIYATSKRIGDLTIGDFWKIDRKTMITNQEGRISLVLVNSDRGQILWQQIKEQVIWEERDLNEAVNGNAQLRAPSQKPIERERFLDNYQKYHDFDKAFKKSGIKRRWIISKVKRSKLFVGTKKIAKNVISSMKQ